MQFSRRRGAISAARVPLQKPSSTLAKPHGRRQFINAAERGPEIHIPFGEHMVI